MTLRTRLFLLVLGVATSLVIAFIVLGIGALSQASKMAQNASRTVLEAQARDYLSRIAVQNAKRNAAVLDQTIAEAKLLALAAGRYFSDMDTYAAVGARNGSANLQLQPQGHHHEGPGELASLFIPNTVQVDDTIERAVLTSRMLDALVPGVLVGNSNAAAAYLATTDGVTRYYPKLALGETPPNFRVIEQVLLTSITPEQNPQGMAQWSPVHEDPAGLGLLVSAIAPVYTDAGEFVGMTGVDFRLSDLAQVIENETLSADSYTFLIDANAKAIALPDRAYTELLERPRAEAEYATDLSELGGDMRGAISAMRSGSNGVVEITDHGPTKFLAYAPLGSQGWSLATVVDTAVILTELGALESDLAYDSRVLAVERLMPIGAAILLVVTSIAFFLAYRFTAPLRELTAAAEAIGNRNWDAPMPPAGDDEVGVLSRTLGGVAQQLKSLIDSLESRVASRTSELTTALAQIEESNDQLSEEVAERQRIDAERLDMELRFKHAFQSAPIGMALMNAHGHIINPNPHMKAMFWPDLDNDVTELLERVVVEADKERFLEFMSALDGPMDSTISAEFLCLAHDDTERQVVFYFSRIGETETRESYLVVLAQDVSATRELTEQLQHQANYDELTGLQNRRAFAKALQHHAHRKSKQDHTSHLLFLDLDQFKIVNDTCGHAEGDRLLVEVSALILGCVRASDVVARLGGDEFAILLLDCSQEIAVRKAEQVRAAVQEYEFYSESDLFRIGVSIGLVSVDAENVDLSELQQQADAACYAAKEAGRNRVHVVEAGGEDKADEHRGDMRWVQRLHDAMDNNRFVLHGQHIRSLTPGNNEIDHIEILLRLRDPNTRRLIPPGAFLPAAERYGLLVQLDKWVVSNLLRSIHVFNTMYPDGQRYWINLSGASLSDEEFSKLLPELVKESGVEPGSVNFEITETVVIRNLGNASKLIGDLHDLGCEIALDDFGSSLSSLAYLKQLNVDYLKIDGSFVKDIVTDEVDRIFVKSIIDIASKLGIKTIAEFVESDDILEVVTELGADYAQGFEIHRPAGLIPQRPIGNISSA